MKIRVLQNENLLSVALAEGDVAETKKITEDLVDGTGPIKSIEIDLDAMGNVLTIRAVIPGLAVLWAALK